MTQRIDLHDGGDLIEVDERLLAVLKVEREIAGMVTAVGRASSAGRVDLWAVAATDQQLAERSSRKGWGAHPEGERLRAAFAAGGIEWPPL